MSRAVPLLLLLLCLAQRRVSLAGPTASSLETAADPCLSQPCKNNGTCSPVLAKLPAAPHRLPLLFLSPQPAYSCLCRPGVTGTECQYYVRCCKYEYRDKKRTKGYSVKY